MKWLRIAVIGIWCSIPVIAVAIWARTQNQIDAIMLELKIERESHDDFSSGNMSVLSTKTGWSLTICYTTDGSTPTSNGAGICTHGTTYP